MMKKTIFTLSLLAIIVLATLFVESYRRPLADNPSLPKSLMADLGQRTPIPALPTTTHSTSHATPTRMAENSNTVIPSFPLFTTPSQVETAARNYLRQQAAQDLLEPNILSTARLRYIHDTGKGPIIAKFDQYIDDRIVFKKEINVMMTREGNLAAISGKLSSVGASLEKQGGTSFKTLFDISPERAINIAFHTMGGNEKTVWKIAERRPEDDFYVPQGEVGDYRPYQPARLKEVLFDAQDKLVPAYYIELVAGEFDTQEQDAYSFLISAVDGRVLMRNNLVSHAAFSYRVYADSEVPHLPLDGPLGGGGTPNPNGSPTSPFWSPEPASAPIISVAHGPIRRGDPWLADHATTTRGNNADVYSDLFLPNGFQSDQGDLRATVNGDRLFDYAYDPSQAPLATTTQNQATLVQLFYTVNFLHDWFYDAGFDESSGNAQEDNYGRGGMANDPLLAEAQDYAMRDNARMTVPADGVSPRMEMFLWRGTTDLRVTIHQPTGIGPFLAGQAAFGPRSFLLQAPVVRMDDGVEPVRDGCSRVDPGKNFAAHIVMIDRGDCLFIDKVRYAQAAGAVGVLIANNREESTLLTMSGQGGDITIPSLFIGQKEGRLLDQALNRGVVQLTLSRKEARDISGAMDTLIVAHEWGHLISNRLIGNANGLTNSQGESLGEGWSDFHALLLAVRQEDSMAPHGSNFQGSYAIGSYAGLLTRDGDPYYYGLRRVPYATDFSKNALTFKHIENDVPLPDTQPRHEVDSENADPHAAGEVWATALWEVYAALLRDTNRLSFAEAQSRMKNYLVASYKMTPLDPTFTEARDALLSVALIHDPQDYLRMVAAFARRGLGAEAQSPDRYSLDHFGVRESFEPSKPWRILSATLDPSRHACDADKILDVGETARLTLTLRNDTPVVAAAQQVTLVSSASIHFAQAGLVQLPEVQPGKTVQIEAELTLNSARPGETVVIDMRLDDRWGGYRQTVWSGPVHYDLKPAFTWDRMDKPVSDWRMQKAETSGSAMWKIQPLEAEGFMLLGENPDRPADFWLLSPPIQVAEGGNFGFQFDHAYAFEADGDGAWDGGVVEIQAGNGSWLDLGAFMTVGYNGTLLASNPSLGGRAAFVGKSMDYPAFKTETVTLGDRFAGQEIFLRFRIGSDDYVGNKGWMIRSVRIQNSRNLPFTAFVDNVLSCDAPYPGDDPLPGFYTLEGMVRGLRKGDQIRLTAQAATIGYETSVLLLGQGLDSGFILNNLPPAPDYRLFVSGDHYESGYWVGIPGEMPSSLLPAPQATVLNLSKAGVAGIDVPLSAHTLHLTLTNLQEEALLELTLWSKRTGGLGWEKARISGPEAHIAFTGLPTAGDYLLYVTVHSGNYRSGFYMGDNRTVGSLSQARPLVIKGAISHTLKMDMGRRITGHVVSAGNDPPVWVTAWSDERGFGVHAERDEKGDFSLNGLLPARDYRLCIMSATKVDGCYGGDKRVPYRLAVPVDVRDADRQDIYFTLESGHQMVGQVAGLATGDSAWVEVWSEIEEFADSTAVGVDGQYRLQGLPAADDYVVTLVASGYQTLSIQKVSVGSRAATIAANGMRTTAVNFNAQRGGRMEGTLQGLQRNDVVSISAHSLLANVHRELTRVAIDDNQHAFVLDGLAEADDYVITLQSPWGRFFYGTNGLLVRHWLERLEIGVGSGATVSGLDFVFNDKVSHRLSGRIAGLLPADESQVVTITAWSVLGDFGSTQRVGNGLWSMDGLAPGDYWIAVQVAGYQMYYFAGFSGESPLWDNAWTAAKTLTVLADRNGLDSTLVLGHTLSGRVVDSNSQPLSAARVSVWDISQSVGGGSISMADGQFRLMGLMSGNYQLEIQAAQGHYQSLIHALDSDRDLGMIPLIQPPGSIRGRVLGLGLSQALILVYGVDGSYITATTTDETGFYRVDALPTGQQYRLDVDTDDHLETIEGTKFVDVEGVVYANIELFSEAQK